MNHGVANLVNLPAYSFWAVSHYWGSMERSDASPELFTILYDRICKPRLLEGAITSFRLEHVWLFWIWHRPAILKLAAQILPFKYSVDFRCEALVTSKQMWHGCVPQSESICLDRCTLAWPCAWNEGTFRPHMEQNCCHIDLLFICFAECEIASNLFMVSLHFREPGIKLCQTAPFYTPVVSVIWHHYIKIIWFVLVMVMEWSDPWTTGIFRRGK